MKFGIRVGAYAAIVWDGAILLVAHEDETGPHYNLPGGGLEPGESARAAVEREVREETTARISVGRLLLVWEYVPERAAGRYGPLPKLGLVFEGALLAGEEPRMPARPDSHQVGVRWVPLEELPRVALLPALAHDLVRALHEPHAVELFEVC